MEIFPPNLGGKERCFWSWKKSKKFWSWATTFASRPPQSWIIFRLKMEKITKIRIYCSEVAQLQKFFLRRKIYSCVITPINIVKIGQVHKKISSIKNGSFWSTSSDPPQTLYSEIPTKIWKKVLGAEKYRHFWSGTH